MDIKDLLNKELKKCSYEELLYISEYYQALQLQQTGVSGSVLKPQLCKDCNNHKEPKWTSKICGDCFFYDNNQQSNFIHKFK
jgi:hypothetical protein